MPNLFSKFNKYRNRIALISNNGLKISFYEILEISKKLKKNIYKNSLILILSDNSLGSILSYICCAKSDAVIMLIDTSIDKKEILRLIQLYRPNYIVKKTNLNNNLKLRKFFNIYDSNFYETNFRKQRLFKTSNYYYQPQDQWVSQNL